MNYLVTGGTGFIGKHLIRRLLDRGGTVYALVREGSREKVDTLRTQLDTSGERLVTLVGDLSLPNAGLARDTIANLKGKIDHVFHLAALYDMTSRDSAAQQTVNVEGTRRAVQLAEAVGARCFHHMSSIAVAGLYKGYWREDMFDEWAETSQPYFRTKHDAEGVVRRESRIPYRIYRPAIVVGDSKTGEIDKTDGPYYFFKLMQKLRNAVPSWVPVIGLEGGRINMVPVDFVADAVDYLAHRDGLDGGCFHLTDPEPYRAGEIMNLFARAAHAPEAAMRIDTRMIDALVPRHIRDLVTNLPPVRRIVDTVLKDIGLPREIFMYVNYPTRFDARDAQRLLAEGGIECPRLDTYAPVLWDYWERHLDPDLRRDRTLEGAVRGKVALVTGASSGIGRAAALRLASAGAKVLLVARDLEQLDETRRTIEDRGGKAWIYAADLSVMEQCDRVIQQAIKEHGRIDVLVNNAGRSIRRSIHHSYDRFHDFERCMQLNYFGAIRMIMGVLPIMEANGGGHIVNISSIGVLANVPRFSAYVASKSALDAFTRCARPEFLDKNVTFTTINMPLVRTPMISPTSFYEHVPALTPDDAADMVARAIVDKPKRIATRLGIFAQVATTLTPQLSDVVLNIAYKLFHDSSAAMGEPGKPDEAPTTEAVAFASLMRGVHW